ncbi:MAG: DNA cytosine methyltransferase [Candidatus Peribacteraceae bacterium]|nr:DNA cytosine methyltransferase [Candidatus Peribacteraceae bacterium]
MFKFIDLFAGIGGIRIPFDELGGKCVFTSEWDKFSCQTYQANFKEKPWGDITKIPAEDIPAHDLLLAGFPCQPFSQAGLKKGFQDTRGTLFFNIAEILNHHRPKAILLENVKRLRSHDGGNTLKVITKTLEDLGYTVQSCVMNAKDFGVPQNRERIYIVGFLGDTNFSFPEPPKNKTRLGDILESHVDAKYTISDKLWAGHQRRLREHKAKGFGFGYCLFDENSEYTSTISARYYKDGSEILIKQKGKNPRKLTPREAARLQGFPDNFIIPVSDGQAYKQFGNSVAVPAIRAVAKRIVPHLAAIKSKSNLRREIDIESYRAIALGQKIIPAIKEGVLAF